MIILGLDGLDYDYVVGFGCKALMQKSFGRTDISEFAEPRTVVLWSSFLAGKNLERRVLQGDLWSFRLEPAETFFKSRRWRAIDVPGLTYEVQMHQKERAALKAFFDKRCTIEAYDEVVFKNHQTVKERFFTEMGADYDILMSYFSLADAIGHLSFGIRPKMRLVYIELDQIAKKAAKATDVLLIISDHGMKAVGRFGDHSDRGFWSFNFETELGNLQITQFRRIIEGLI
jgi:hypothetical protein